MHPIPKTGVKAPRLRGRLRLKRLLLLLGLSLSPAVLAQQARQPPPGLSFHYAPDSGSAPQALFVRVDIAPGWHINSDAPLDEFLVPTSLRAEAEGVVFAEPEFPPPRRVFSEAAGGDMLLFSGTLEVKIPVRAMAAGKGGANGKGKPRTRVTLRYQACDHATCFPPREIAMEG